MEMDVADYVQSIEEIVGLLDVELSQRLAPIKRDEFINRLRALGFTGPIEGTRHAFMLYGRKRQTIPSDAEYSVDLLNTC